MVRHKELFNICSFNARTLSTSARLTEFQLALTKIKWDVVGISEARIKGVTSQTLSPSGDILFNSGLPNLARHGVAFLVRQQLAQTAVFTPVSERLASLSLPSIRLYIVLGYGPTSSAPDHDYEAFLDRVEMLLKKRPQGFTPILIGDYNAKVKQTIGNENVIGRFTGDGNERGEMLSELCLRHTIRLWNTFLPKRENRRWTWRSPNAQTFNQIDFAGAPPSLKVIDVDVINRFLYDSDHRMLRLTFKPPNFHHRHRPGRQSQAVEMDPQLYSSAARLIHPPRTHNSADAYFSIFALTQTALAASTIPRIIPPRISLATQALLRQRHLLKSDLSPLGRIAFAETSKRARSQLKEDVQRRQERMMIQAIERGKSMKRARKDNEVATKRFLALDHVTGSYSQKKTEQVVKTFYDNLYSTTRNIPLSIRHSPDALLPFSTDEVLLALSHLKCGHAAGCDGITPDMLFRAREVVAPLFVQLLNSCLRGDPIPCDLLHARISLIFKKGDSNDIGNFRPIALLTTTLKVMTRTILQRMEQALEENEDSTQTGFRKRFSTQDNIHAIKQIAEKTNEYNISLYMAFIDFRKAFDTVEWTAVWNALAEQGIHQDLIFLLKRLYDTATTSVSVNEREVPVIMRRGVRQGDTLSPKLFNAVLRYCLTRIDWGERGIRINGTRLTHLCYADDIVLFANSEAKLATMIQDLASAAEQIGLQINHGKTKLMKSTRSRGKNLNVNGNRYDYVNSFVYLGSLINLPLDRLAEIKARTQSAWAAFARVADLLTKKSVPLWMKRKIFDSCVTPAALYGAESWALTEKARAKLETVQHKMERRMLGITMFDRWTNERIRANTRVKDWIRMAVERKMRWAIQISRMDGDRWAKRTTEWIPYDGRRSSHRPPVRWIDEVRLALGRDWTYLEEQNLTPLVDLYIAQM